MTIRPRWLGLVLATLFLIPCGVSAYEFTRAKWSSQQLPVPYHVAEPLSTDLPDGEALAAVQAGYDAWTDVECSFMAWVFRGRTDNTAWGAADAENVASWRESNWDDTAYALAITSSISDFESHFVDTDIKFNGVHHQWAHFSGNPGGRDPRTDIQSVATHEVGHAVGLDHTDVPGSTMLPSTMAGTTGPRSLGRDDILGVCEIYPSGEAPPEPGPDPGPDPVSGSQGFGEICSYERPCADGLVCISDGLEAYCSRQCRDGDECPAGYYCAQLSGGAGACARGEDPASAGAGFGEACGGERACEQGLLCVNDDGEMYCSGPCDRGECADGYFCAQLQSGGDVCARGDGPNGGQPLPGPGEPCGERGLCAEGLFCLNDGLHRDERTGALLPYCTQACEAGACPDGFRCVDVDPDGTACQIIPSAGHRQMGDECWVNPDNRFEPPTCGSRLECINYSVVDGEVVDPGVCTKSCAAEDCCPKDWGCVEVTPVFGQCIKDRDDSERFVCEGERPQENPGFNPFANDDTDTDTDPDLPPAQEGSNRDGGGMCAMASPNASAIPMMAIWLIGLTALSARRRRDRSP